MLRLLICLLIITVACQEKQIQVHRVAPPDYPREANLANIQGTVTVNILIGPDGRVVEAHGVGAHPILVEAAESNVRQWVFGPLPRTAEYPISQTVTYVFKLEGPPAYVLLMPAIRTQLPNEVELRARLFKSDYAPPTLPQVPGEKGEKK